MGALKLLLAWLALCATPVFGQGQPPTILRFVVTPSTVLPDQQATLSWIVQNANMVTIYPGIGIVPASGSITATDMATTTYTLSAQNNFGVSTASAEKHWQARQLAGSDTRSLHGLFLQQFRSRALAATGAPDFQLSTSLLDFGATGVGFVPVLPLTITPTTAPIGEIDVDTRFASGFSVLGSSVFPLSSAKQVLIRFSPAAAGPVSGLILFTAPQFSITRQLTAHGTGAFITVIPHSGFGGGFVTQLSITNLSGASNRVTANRFAQDGSLVDTSQNILDPNATVVLADDDRLRSQSLTLSWYQIASDGPISAAALFDAQGIGGNTSVGALSAPPLTDFTVPFRTGGGFTSGVAVANPANFATLVKLSLLDQDGNLRSTDMLTLNPGTQTAFVLTDRPVFQSFLCPQAPCLTITGSLQVSSDPTAAVSAMVVGSQDGKLFSLPVAGVSGPLNAPLLTNVPGATYQTIIPHSAFGGGFITRLFVTNLSDSNNPITIYRFNQSGQLVDVRNVTLQRQAEITLEDPESNRNQPLTVQWFAIDSLGPITASVLFDSFVNGVRNPVGALSSPAMTSFTVPIQQSPVSTTGVAILNLSASDNNITLQLFDAGGTRRAQDTLMLHAFSQTTFLVTDRSPLAAVLCPAGACVTFNGSLAVTSAGATQPLAAMVVGSNRGQIFSLPVQQSPR
jgi:hypothetical protein